MRAHIERRSRDVARLRACLATVGLCFGIAWQQRSGCNRPRRSVLGSALLYSAVRRYDKRMFVWDVESGLVNASATIAPDPVST